MDTVITIRNARVEDAVRLHAAEQETARTPGLLVSQPYELTLDAFATKITELAKAGRYIVAEADGRIVGHALLDPMGLQATAHVYRLTIVVHPDHLGKGIGTALMKDLMSWAEGSRQVGKVELLVRARNARAIGLYSKLGFVEEGRFKSRIKLPDATFIDDIAMAWFPTRTAS